MEENNFLLIPLDLNLKNGLEIIVDSIFNNKLLALKISNEK
jgi:hypothetical protein